MMVTSVELNRAPDLDGIRRGRHVIEEFMRLGVNQFKISDDPYKIDKRYLKGSLMRATFD